MLAQILIGNREKRAEKIKQLLRMANFSETGDVDSLIIDNEKKVGISEIRKIINFFSIKPIKNKGKFVAIINAHLMGMDAQNALLKTLEELKEEDVLILGADNEDRLLPTIRSRAVTVNLEALEDKQVFFKEEIERIIASDYSLRFEEIEKIDDKEGFLNALISYFQLQSRNNPEKYLDFLKKLNEAQIWLGQNVNSRAILEYLMLSIPNEK